MNYAKWLFQWAFLATSATIVSGAVAERLVLSAYAALAVVMATLVYPMLAHWAWSSDGALSAFRGDASGSGALFGCGVLDFAGSGVVHVTGGIAALWAVLLLGPRESVFFRGGKVHAPPGQSDALKTLGTLSLW
jgi:ammonium transporter, Amt family